MPKHLSSVKIKRPGRPRGAPPYHHGNLRTALVGAAIKLLEASGPDALSLRGVAAEAGVSQTAPYSHFKDKRALLAAVAEVGFERLRARMTPLDESASTARERFLQTGRGYVAFALGSPGLFRLMFNSVLGPLSDFPDLERKAQEAYGLFHAGLEGVVEGGRLPRAEVSTLRVSAWALVHGLASLLVEQRLGGVDAERLTAEVTELYLRRIVEPA